MQLWYKDNDLAWTAFGRTEHLLDISAARMRWGHAGALNRRYRINSGRSSAKLAAPCVAPRICFIGISILGSKPIPSSSGA
jgi:hypothetical protein